MLGRRQGEKWLYGKIAAVYQHVDDDDVKIQKVEISLIQHQDDGREFLDDPRIYIIPKGTKLERGGALTHDELAEWLDN